MMEKIIMTTEELAAITGYTQCCKQLSVLHNRGFHRAYIARRGGVVLERVHFETVSRGESGLPAKVAKLGFMRTSA